MATTRAEEQAAMQEVFEGRACTNPNWVEPPCTEAERAANHARWIPKHMTPEQAAAFAAEAPEGTVPGDAWWLALTEKHGPILYTGKEKDPVPRTVEGVLNSVQGLAWTKAAAVVAEEMRPEAPMAVPGMPGVYLPEWNWTVPVLAQGCGAIHLTGPMDFLPHSGGGRE